jgi:hypothetical protein
MGGGYFVRPAWIRRLTDFAGMTNLPIYGFWFCSSTNLRAKSFHWGSARVNTIRFQLSNDVMSEKVEDGGNGVEEN